MEKQKGAQAGCDGDACEIVLPPKDNESGFDETPS